MIAFIVLQLRWGGKCIWQGKVSLPLNTLVHLFVEYTINILLFTQTMTITYLISNNLSEPSVQVYLGIDSEIFGRFTLASENETGVAVEAKNNLKI